MVLFAVVKVKVKKRTSLLNYALVKKPTTPTKMKNVKDVLEILCLTFFLLPKSSFFVGVFGFKTKESLSVIALPKTFLDEI